MEEFVAKSLGSIGIGIEIIGFLFILWFWRVPTYPALNKWFRFQKIYKIFFGTKRYENRITDIVFYDKDEDLIKIPNLALSGYNPTVPRAFIPFWNKMKWIGFVLVLVGLSLQFVQNWM